MERYDVNKMQNSSSTTINGVVVDGGGGLNQAHQVILPNKRPSLVRREQSFRENNMSNSSSNGHNNNNNNRESYKPLGDYFGEAVKAGKAMPNSINKPARMGPPADIGSPYKHVPLGGTRSSNYSSNSGNRYTVNSRQQFGNPDLRASYSERTTRQQQQRLFQQQQQQHPVHHLRRGLVGPPPVQSVYKSNSSLDIDHEVGMVQEAIQMVSGGQGHHYHQQGRINARDFGSHGSIDVITRQEIHQVFPDIGRSSFDSNSIGNNNNNTLQRGNKSEDTPSVVSSGSLDGDSPKQKKKGGFFSKDSSSKSQKGLFKKFRSSKEDDASSEAVSSSEAAAASSLSDGLDDRHRRRFFSHYDVGSVCASLSLSSQLKTLERRNTTTGASAASAALRSGEAAQGEKDQGDNVSNELVLR